MILLLDIGNTHTHLGLASRQAVRQRRNIPTADWRVRGGLRQLRAFAGRARLEGVAVCSVVPWATPRARQAIAGLGDIPWFELTARTGAAAIDPSYPKPESIGPDRLANAIAARHYFGAPCLAIDFGTAVTFDVVNRAGRFVGGLIAPGLSLMTGYLHEKTALLPAVRATRPRRVIGRSTEEAIRSAAVHGFRGLVHEVIQKVKAELRCPSLPVVATGSYAPLVTRALPEITAVRPHLTFEGLCLAWDQRRED